MPFVHLNVKSSYSLLDSTIKLDQYVHLAKQKGHEAIAISDHEVLNGVYQFSRLCKSSELKPLIGMSLNIYLESETRPCHFILYARNFKGYQSLVELSNRIQLHKEKIYLKDLANHLNILPIVSFYETFIEEMIYLEQYDLVNQLLNDLDQYFDEWYINVDPISSSKKTVEEWLMKQENSISQKTVLTCRVRYLKSGERIGYNALKAMKIGTAVHHVERQADESVHFLDEAEIRKLVDPFWYPSMDRTVDVLNLCDINFPDRFFALPKFKTSNNMSSDEYLAYLCEKNLSKRYSNSLRNEAKQRLEHELNIIQSMQFSDYFLIVWDIVQFAKKNNILVGPGRGSAAGSIVAYLLGIIEVDPIEYGLLFERFLNPERMSMPDIDIDFSDYRRDEVIKYVGQKYGKEFVAQIITFGTFQARSTIRELSKVFQIEKEQLNYLLSRIQNQTGTLKAIINEDDQLKTYIKQSKRLISMFKAAFIIEGLPRHYSTHAAGVVISNEPLISNVPVIRGQDDVYLTQYPMKDLEEIGLLKMDFLGLRNLSFLERIIKQIEEKENKTIDLANLPLDDQNTYKLLQKGFTSGVFQLESDGMKKALRSIRPTSIGDVVAVNALFRPGPMQFIDTFARRKNGHEKITFIHHDLKGILEPTYGVLVYQEQIMQVVSKMAGFSYGQADIFRRAISKKDASAIKQLKEQFINGCNINGYDESIAVEIFEWIERFANYGFNKSHAVAYSLISYQTAYFKANYPAYFYAELMTSFMHDQTKLERYVKEARNVGIKILPPSINKSFGKFTVESTNQIRFGLLAIKGLGKQAYDEIIRARKNIPFKHLFDFCKRIELKAVNQPVIESLIMAGAFDETNENRAQLLASVMPALEQGELFSGLEEQIGFSDDLFEMEVEYRDVQPFTSVKQMRMEKEVLGFVMSEHPFVKVRRALQRVGIQTIQDSINDPYRRQITIASIVDRMNHVRTKRGEKMAFITIVDETKEIDAVIFPSVHRKVNRWLQEETFVKIIGKVDEREGKKQIIIDEIEPITIDDLPKTSKEQIYIKLKEENEKEQLTYLRKLSKTYSGTTMVNVYSNSQKKMYQLSAHYDLECSEAVFNELKTYFGSDNVVVKP